MENNTAFNLDNEVNKFNLNDYVNKNTIYLEKNEPEDDEFDKDDLLYTNAIRDDYSGDLFDKGRYSVDNITYLNVSCKEPNNIINFADESINSTGNEFKSSYTFMPFTSMTIDVTDNILYIKVIDILKSNIITNLSNNTDYFIINLNTRTYTLVELENEIYTKMNRYLYDNATCDSYDQLSNASSSDIFTINVETNPDPDDIRPLLITITSHTNFKFMCQFSEFGQESPIENNDSCNNYSIKLQKPIRNVKSIRIISSSCPNSDTFINQYNYVINFSLKDTSIGQIIGSYTYIIPCFDYTIDSLLTNLTDGMNIIILNELSITDYFKYTYDSTSGIIDVYTNPLHMSIKFKINYVVNEKIKCRNLYEMLGYRESFTYDYVNSFNNIIIKYNKETKTGYETCYKIPKLIKTSIWIDLNSYETIYDPYNNKFWFNRFCYFEGDRENDGQFQPIATIFENTINLEYLNVKLYDDDGNPYNTNNVCHWFMLEIIYQSDRLIATNINSKRDHYRKS